MSGLMDGMVRSAREDLTAHSQLGLVYRRRDLLAAGITDALQSAMFRRGMLVRLRHGVYALADVVERADATDRHRIDVAAVIAAAERPIWAFGASAALLHGLPLPAGVPRRIEVLRNARQDERSLTRPSRHPIQLPGVHVTTHVMTAKDVTTADDVPSVIRPLAAISAARQLSHRRKVALFDSVLWDGSVTTQDLSTINEEWRSRGGKAQIDAAILESRRGAQTVLETISRLALIDQGLPEPQLQAPFYDRLGLIGYVDMYWAGMRVIGEADGRLKYVSRDDLVKEKVREDRLRALGFRLVRWMWDEINARPEDVARRIRDARS